MPPKKAAVVEPVDDYSDESEYSEEQEQEQAPEPEPVKPIKKRAPAKPKAPAMEKKAPVKRRTKAQIAADAAANVLGPNSELSVNPVASQIAEANAQPDPVDDPTEELSLADLQKLIAAQVATGASQLAAQSNTSQSSEQTAPDQAAAPAKKPRGRPRKNPTAAQQLESLNSNKEIIDSVKLLSKLVLESGQQYKTINERLDSLTKSEDQAMKKQMADDIAKTRMFFQNLHKK
jgi:hypothetical protein